MDQQLLSDALAQSRRIGTVFHEILDVSRQIADAVDREDQVSVRMLVNMRGEPIARLKAAREALARLLEGAEPETRERLNALIKGAAAQTPEERPLAAQSAANERLLFQLLELDRVLNKKIAREDSVYN